MEEDEQVGAGCVAVMGASAPLSDQVESGKLKVESYGIVEEINGTVRGRGCTPEGGGAEMR